MKGVNKKLCRDFLEPLIAPNSDSGLFLLPKLQYIVRTAIKIVGHRRLLVLCLYARGDTPGGRPELTYTMFQASDSFVTYDHRPAPKGKWRTVMLENLEQDYHFTKNGCAFYSRPDEERVLRFCKPYVPDTSLDDGFWAMCKMQQQIRDKETLRRRKNRERKIRSKMSGLRSLPRGMERWLRRDVLPAYFFYDYRKGKQPIWGLCSACGETVELPNVRHNAKGVCPRCGRKLTMKSNGKRGRIWDRTTASVVQRIDDNNLIIRIAKAYLTWPKTGPCEMDFYEETRVFVKCLPSGKAESEAYHHSDDSVGITRWKKGYPPVTYLYGQNFAAETCGALYCKNLSRALRGTPWQYSQLEAFYRGINDDIEVLPYLEAYLVTPAIEFFVKLSLFWLAAHVTYRRDGLKVIDPSGKKLRDVLQIEPCDLSWLQRPEAGVRDLLMLRILRKEGHEPSQEIFLFLEEYGITEVEGLACALHYSTPHKVVRYLVQQFAKGDPGNYRGRAGILSDYKDYLGFCEELQYDLKNEFVLFPKHLQNAHDQAQGRIKLHRVEPFDQQVAAQQDRLKKLYHFKKDGLVVVPPHSAQEIVAEGQRLHHCVGGYAERMAKGQCVILFLREEKHKTKPFYTVEVHGDRILQVRGAHNRAPTPEVTAFLSAWEKKKHLQNAA